MKKTIFCVGKFTPIHIGHVRIIEEMCMIANTERYVPMVNIISSQKSIASIPKEVTFESMKQLVNQLDPKVIINQFGNAYDMALWFKNSDYNPVAVVVGDDREFSYQELLSRVISSEINLIEYSLNRNNNSANAEEYISSTKIRQMAQNGIDFDRYIPNIANKGYICSLLGNPNYATGIRR